MSSHSSPSLLSPGPYHILTYGTLLGTTVYQSFVGGIVSYRALPRAQFASLQTALTPVYFAIQTALPVLLALSYPGRPSRVSPSSPQSGIYGVLEPQNRSSVLMPLLGAFVTAATNLVVLGPATTRVMKERKHQETRDGKKSYDQGEQSDEMQALNKRFARLHGANALINMVGMGFIVWYGVLLGGRIE